MNSQTIKSANKMKNRFFKPFVGSNYNVGIRGKKILILGASFYCPKTECKFYEKCTDVQKKASSSCDATCPLYNPVGKVLHNEPSYCIDDAPQTYQTFAAYISKYLDYGNYENVWSYLAFTNYVQFFLPATGNGFRETRWSDLSERDFEAFIETVKEVEPDIVIIWGCVINSRLKEENVYVTDQSNIGITEGYMCHMKIPEMRKEITLLNPYHPSSSAWHSALSIFEKYLKQALNEK